MILYEYRCSKVQYKFKFSQVCKCLVHLYACSLFLQEKKVNRKCVEKSLLISLKQKISSRWSKQYWTAANGGTLQGGYVSSTIYQKMTPVKLKVVKSS